MKNNVVKIVFFILVFLCIQNVRAEEKIVTDIESDKLEIDRKTLISIFTGNVSLKRVKLTIIADKINVFQSRDEKTKKQKIKYIEAFGSPARLIDYNSDNQKMNAIANIIIYNQNTDLIQLTGDATLSTDDDTFISQVIWYNKKTQEMRAGKIDEVAKEKTSRVKIKFFEDPESNNAEQ